MYYTADVHTHSHYAEKCSPLLCLESMYQWAQIKGINVIGTGDFTHPAWFKELQDKLEPDGNGLYKLKQPPQSPGIPGIKLTHNTVRFCLSAEISSEYIYNNKLRRIHNLLYAPDFDTAGQINARLAKFGNLSLNGRPTVTLSSRDLLELVISVSDRAYLVPAHAWTPWFSLFGSVGGYDSLDECFLDLTPHIFAIETGLSSDPPMNWLCSNLDHITLLSSSDAHSLENLGREVNRFDTEMSYDGMFDAIKTGIGFMGTLEAFPEKGKYSYDGHRICNMRLSPYQTIVNDGICPVCGKPVTMGAMYRLALLSDRVVPQQPARAADFDYIIPLPEILSELHGVGVKTKKIEAAYSKAINFAGNEFNLLKKMPLEDIHAWQPSLGEAIKRMRKEEVHCIPGYDGVYGSILLFPDGSHRPGKDQQGTLF
ncbi:MAG: endonuclease Q family protein [Ferruginibacter sp.]